MPMLERQVKRSYVRTMFHDMTLLAITVLLMQAVSLFFFRDKLRHADPDDQSTYPLVGTEVASFPPGSRFLPSGNYLPVEGLETVQLMNVDGALEVIILDGQFNPIQQWSLPENVPDSSVAAVDVDDDQLLDLVYTKVWHSLSGVDSLHFCAQIADGVEILLDRQIRPAEAKRWSAGYSLPTTPGGCPSSSGINRFVAYYTADLDAAMVHRLLFFNRTRTPELVARVDIANHPGLGYWKRSRRGEEVFLFGGRPDNPSILLPIQVIAPDGGVQNTLLSGARATLMEISGDGIIRWVRSFPPAPGEVYAFPSSGDTLFAVHIRKPLEREAASIVSFFQIYTQDGTILQFRTHDNMEFTRFVHAQPTSAVPAGMLTHADSLHILQEHDFWQATQYDGKLAGWAAGARQAIWANSESWLFPLEAVDGGIRMLDETGTVKAYLPGSLAPFVSVVHPGFEGSEPYLPILDARGVLTFYSLDQNPDPYWRFRPYLWLSILLLLPHFLMLSLYATLRVRQARRDARSRLMRAYRRLRERFLHRSEQLAVTNQKLETESEERRRMNEELSFQREHLDAIFNSVLDGLITLDREGIITRANLSFGELFQLDHEEVPGMALLDLFPQQRDVLARLLTSEKNRSSVSDTQVELSTLHDETKMVRLRMNPLLHLGKASTERLVIFRDETQLMRLEDLMQTRFRFHNLIGQSERMRQIYSMIEHIGPSDATVLITGESGTGKELVARALHHQSHRVTGPFVAVHCAALTETLLESELFGHVKGSFTGAVRDKVGYFERAEGGTLFLDEFGEVSPAIQVKLLRVLNDKVIERVGDTTPISVDTRILIATNRVMTDEVQAGRFREDLYYRINVLAIEIPPLRERRDDIPLLITDLLQTISKQAGKEIEEISEDVLSHLMQYSWPGNIRELRNCLERAVIVTRDKTIRFEHLPPEIRNASSTSTPDADKTSTTVSSTQPAPTERDRILHALDKHGWVVARAARELGIARQTLYRKMASMKLERHES
ncbi:sigma 54-interacting transcriptional regulator [bacterium]|nr:sigma 54-interacting transcriptional regulator [bacterium]